MYFNNYGLAVRESPRSNLMIFFLMLNGFLVISPIFSWLTPASEIYLVATSFFILFYLVRYKNSILNAKYFYIVLLLSFCSIIPAVYWLEPKYLLYPSFFLVAFLLGVICKEEEISCFVDIATKVILVLLAGAIFGFFLAKFGFDYIWKFKNPDGRWNYLYYTTLTNYVRDGFIRPSGIFDEPGTFSFVICLVAFFRLCLGKNYQVTWLILVLGFVTFSLAHLVFCLVFIVAERFNTKKFMLFCFAVIVILLISIFTGVSGAINERLLGRLEVAGDGSIKGDNRTVLMVNAISEIKQSEYSLLVGLDPDCLFNVPLCKNKYPLMGANPVTPLVFQGVFLSWPYYALVVFSFVAFFKYGRVGLAFFAVGLLFVQRPYLMLAGYSLLGVLSVRLIKIHKLKF